jgi:hypothetical protein
MKQFFTAIWNFLRAIGEARAHSRISNARWDY